MPRPPFYLWQFLSAFRRAQAIALGICLTLLLGWPVAGAQSGCNCAGNKQSIGTLRLTVLGQKSGDKLFWVLKAFPAEADLQLARPALRGAILSAIAQNTTGAEPAQFGLSDDADFNFPVTLNDALLSVNLTLNLTESLATAPSTENQEATGTLCICGPADSAQPSAPTPPGDYRVVMLIKTTFATQAASQLPARPVQQTDITVDNLSVKLFFTNQDLKHAATDTAARKDPRSRVIAELTAVARQLSVLARTPKLLAADGKLLTTPIDDPNLVSDSERAPNGKTAFTIASTALRTAILQSYELKAPPKPALPRSEVKWRELDLTIGRCELDACVGGPTEPCNGLCGTQPVFVIALGGLQIVRHVALKVQPDDLDRLFGDQPVGQEFNEMRRAIAKKLNQQFKDKFTAQPGHIVTWEQIEADQRRLCPKAGTAPDSSNPPKCQAVEAFTQISSPPKRLPHGKLASNPIGKQPARAEAGQNASVADNSAAAEPAADDSDYNDDSALIYEVLRKRKTPGALGISSGLRYSPEDSLLGTVGLREFNLLGLGKLSLGEHISLDYARGDQAQKIRFQLARPFEAPGRSGFRLKDVSIAVNYFRDRNQRLGNLTTDEIEARELGSSAAVSFGYDSFTPADYLVLNCESFNTRKRTHVTLNGDTSLEFRELNIPESQRLLTLTGLNQQLLPKPNTQLAPLALNLTLAVTHDARELNQAGLGHLNFSLDSKLQRGLELFGADYRYHKIAVTARGELVFGALSPEDFFLRYTHGIGQSGTQTPVTELFRLGGSQNVRGMEEGEFIGRQLSYGQAEFGINAFALWHMLRQTAAPELNRTPCSNAAGTDAARSPLPFDPASIYLKTFFDFARISDPTSFTNPALGLNLLPRRLEQRANGYGIAVELRNLSKDIGAQVSFTFGYARSPRSRLHPSGTLFTGVSYSF